MVKLGFIVEGATEKIILEQSDFFGYLLSLGIDYVPEVIDANGNGNLLPRNIEAFSKTLEDNGATRIIVLTDKDTDECITHTKKNRISPLPHHVVTVSVQVIEAWFLADTAAMRIFLKDPLFVFDEPEAEADPYKVIRDLRTSKIDRGINGKLFLAKTMIRSCGFSIQKAAMHPNARSVRYFLKAIM